MMAGPGGDGLRLLEWMDAVKLGKRDARHEGAQVACFREWFVGADEFRTAQYAQSAVIKFISLEQARQDVRRNGGRYDRAE